MIFTLFIGLLMLMSSSFVNREALEARLMGDLSGESLYTELDLSVDASSIPMPLLNLMLCSFPLAAESITPFLFVLFPRGSKLDSRFIEGVSTRIVTRKERA